ncbi:MAG: hypothetical protein NC336_01180 [Clostridium sp.]|nr:hypothetical protein [Clostridium sp.]
MNPEEEHQQTEPKKKRRHPAARLLKWLVATAGIILLLIVAAVSAVVWILTPERLTPLVERHGSEYLDADLEVRRVELFYWSTFPRVVVEIDSLTIRSRAFDKLSPEQRGVLPSYADTLLTLGSFRGAVNLPAILEGEIRLSDVRFDDLSANLVSLTPEAANYNIVPAPAEAAGADTASADLPTIEIDRFTLAGENRFRYWSVADTTEATLWLTTTLAGSAAPLYTVAVEGSAAAQIARTIDLPATPFSLDGDIRWDMNSPCRVAVEMLSASFGDIRLCGDAEVDFADSIRIERLSLEIPRLDIASAAEMARRILPDAIPAFTTDLVADASLKIRSPWTVSTTTLPDAEVSLTIDQGRLVYDRLNLRQFAVDIHADLPGGDPNRAVVTIDHLLAVGPAVGFSLKGKVLAAGNIMDPLVDATFKGGVGLSRLPRQLLDRLSCSVAGTFRGETDFRLRPSYVNRTDFHRIHARGRLTLSDFAVAMRDSSASASIGRAELRFGSDSKLALTDSLRVDSLLTVALDIDTLRFSADAVELRGTGLHAGLASRNVAASADTTEINPIGGRVSAGSLSMRSADADSVRLHLRDISAGVSLRRFNGQGRRPLLSLDIESKRFVYADRLNRASLADASIGLTLHPRQQPRLGRRQLAVYDSICALYPNLSLDSVYTLTIAEMASRRNSRPHAAGDSLRRRARADSVAQTEKIDFGVDNSIQRWLKLWEASGTIKAARGRAFTPYFPLRNELIRVDVAFNTDSLVVRDTRYRAGRSSVVVNGAIRNITSAVTSRRGEPVAVDLSLRFDTLDVNAFADAIFSGSAFASRVDSTTVIAGTDDDADDATMQHQLDQTVSPDERAAFIVPVNLRADFSVSARHMLYADVWFHRVSGSLAMADGAVQLNRLSGLTDMGSLDLTALYSAPTPDDINFATGMVLKKLDLKKFLGMMPQVDSILPLLKSVSGYVTADMAITTELDSMMDFRFNTLKAVMKLDGDSLTVIDPETFKTMAKWLMFKDKQHNMIDHMSVELMVENNYLDVYPFMFDFDRYRLGVWGGNDLDMNYEYHVAVLKSPLPFKFGLTIKGNSDDFKVRLGRANFNPDKIISQRHLTDTVRVNLINEIQRVFRFGVNKGGGASATQRVRLQGGSRPSPVDTISAPGEALTRADSIMLMQEGIIPLTEEVADSLRRAETGKKPKIKKKQKKE